MENKIYGRIYLITNKINKKQYVGQTIMTIKTRFSKHCTSKIPVISKAIRKYGRENFIIQEITIAYSQEELTFLEGVYMLWFNTLAPNGYNIKEIIDGKGKCSEETKRKMSISAKTSERLKQLSKNGKKTQGRIKQNSSSIYIGVYFHKKIFVASIGYNNKTIHIGHFNYEKDAAQAYDIKALELFGSNCNLNFPELRQDYIDGKIIIKNSSRSNYSKSKESGIVFEKNKYWRLKWFDLNERKNKTKNFQNLDDAVKYKYENIGIKNFHSFKSKKQLID